MPGFLFNNKTIEHKDDVVMILKERDGINFRMKKAGIMKPIGPASKNKDGCAMSVSKGFIIVTIKGMAVS